MGSRKGDGSHQTVLGHSPLTNPLELIFLPLETPYGDLELGIHHSASMAKPVLQLHFDFTVPISMNKQKADKSPKHRLLDSSKWE